MKKFWIVGQFDGPTGVMAANPHKHATAALAYAEAGRLATKLPGVDFVVFKADGAAYVQPQPVPPVKWSKAA
jgi:hypothetical protein